jgi:hypothetical protein
MPKYNQMLQVSDGQNVWYDAARTFLVLRFTTLYNIVISSDYIVWNRLTGKKWIGKEMAVP